MECGSPAPAFSTDQDFQQSQAALLPPFLVSARLILTLAFPKSYAAVPNQVPKTQPSVGAEILPANEFSMASIGILRLPFTLPPPKLDPCLTTRSTLLAHVAAASVARKCLLVWEAKPQANPV
jgi:hypothetical protein